MSMLGSFLNEDKDYTKEEFIDALWDKICDSIESVC